MLEETTKSFSSFSPVVVPVSENETEEEFLYRWEKFDALPQDTKNKLSAEETSEEIKNIKQIFNLELPQISHISRIIRSYYFGEIGLDRFPQLLSEKLGIDSVKAQSIVEHIKEKIINKKIKTEENHTRRDERDENIVKLPILEALKRYPDLGNQKISDNDIKLEIFPHPVKPSIRNWITDYRQTTGTENRGTMEKSHYLFHGSNARKLSPQELQKLSLILKSLDNHIPLAINAKKQRVIFPITEESSQSSTNHLHSISRKVKNENINLSSQKQNEHPIGNNADNFHFSSPQTFEAEKKEKAPDKNMNYRQYQIYPTGMKDDDSEEKSRPKKNIINLKEDF